MGTLFTRVAVGDANRTITVSLTANTPKDVQLPSWTRSFILQAPANAEAVWFRLNAGTAGTNPVARPTGDHTDGSYRLPPSSTRGVDIYPAGSVLRLVSTDAAVVYIEPIQASDIMGAL
jgi:hypothetical protein